MPDIDWTKAEAVAAQNAEWDHHDVTPVAVTIGRTTYIGASYLEREQRDRRFYLLGERPSSAKRAVYRFPDDDADWYVAGWIEQSRADNPSIKSFHPFGAWFLLHRWPHEEFAERIDAHDGRELRRMDASVLEPAKETV